MNYINISIAPKTYDGSRASYFKTTKANINEMETILKNHNYSLIRWNIEDDKRENEYNRKRNARYFESASGIIVDIDEGLPIVNAIDKLKSNRLNYIIITSKSHQIQKKDSPAQDRYHILLFFQKETKSKNKYRSAFSYIKNIFPMMDVKCKDAARFIFASPDDAKYFEWSDGQDLDLDSLPDDDFLYNTIEENKVWEFDPDINVKLYDGRVKQINQIDNRERCHCIREDHEDKNPSAIIEFDKEKDKWMSYCYACEWTGWSDKTSFELRTQDKMKHFYYLGKDVYEFGIAEDKFFLNKNSEKNFCYTIGADFDDEQEIAIKGLIKNKRLRTLTRVDYVGNPDADESYYSVNYDAGIVTVNIAAIKSDVIDNKFIENYLDTTFGKYKDFVKQYLAMYTYTNYIQLPTLVLYGPRGSSKTTFAGMVSDIYPTLYMDWTGEAGSFTNECEKKLLIIEENMIDEKSQYKTLKKYTGQEELLVNKKYQPEYMVRNNVNIILISNEMIPLYVEKTEMPTDPTNNQFFVWEFQKLNSLPDGTFRNKIKERLGHYIRTELKTAYNGINKNYTRYGIKVPITTYETELFENNTTNIEAQADLVLEKIENRENSFSPNEGTYELFRQGYLPVALVEEYATGVIHPNTIIKNLKKRNKIAHKSERKEVDIKNSNGDVIGKKKYTCYKII